LDTGTKPKFAIVTLGCEKNRIDSEGMGQMLRGAGYEATVSTEEASVLIVNTCGFLEAARQEALDTLNQLAATKRDDQLLIASGCMVELYPERISGGVTVLDGQLSARHWPDIAKLTATLGQQRGLPLTFFPAPPQIELNAALTEQCPTAPASYADPQLTGFARQANGGSAFVKIAEGCDAKCSFCIIPQIRGGHISKPLPQIIAEVKELAAQGVKEIIYISQDSTYYGLDLGIRDGLAGLLEETVQQVPEIEWLRIMYAYPARMTPRLIQTMAELPQVCKYVDMPLQHGSEATLRRMRRPPNMDRVRRVLSSMREAMPDLALRTTFIVGFPGETNAEFNALIGFINEGWFDHVGVFTYSAEEKSESFNLEGHLHPRVKEKRRKLAMAAQQRISLKRNQALVGKNMRVLIEGEGELEDERGSRTGEQIYVARSYREAPEVDGYIFVQPRKHTPLTIGQMLDVLISRAEEYDLWAKPVADR
jgi:ribosomal protein S12 methylthiotransferase